MALSNPFKLQKLKINVYADRQRRGLPQDDFTVMFNPNTISMRHENIFQKYQGINTSGREARYSHSHSEEVRLDLVLDGTGVTHYGLSTLVGGLESVSDQVDKFLELCFDMDGDIHEPKFLKIQWGTGVLKDFDCRLKAVDIAYTAFEPSGAPLRATLKTTFVEDIATSKRIRQEGKNSPDLSHVRLVKSGDTLPLLTKEIYGSAEYYLRVAQFNQLNDFRNLQPGQKLIFPPLEKSPVP